MSEYSPKIITTRDGQRLTLRRPEVDDAQAIIDYLDDIRNESGGIMFSPQDDLPSLEWERDWLQSNRDRDDSLQIAAWNEAGQPVALAGVSRNTKRYRISHTATLGISVRRAYWRMGVGRSLMTEVVGFAKQHPEIDVLQLCVFSFNRKAIALYEAMGFAPEGEQRFALRFEDGSYAHEVLMSQWVGPGEPPDALTEDPVLMLERFGAAVD